MKRAMVNCKIRKLLGLSQADLAKRIGTNQSTICHYERGERSPRFIERVIEMELDAEVLKKKELFEQLQRERDEG